MKSELCKVSAKETISTYHTSRQGYKHNTVLDHR